MAFEFLTEKPDPVSDPLLKGMEGKSIREKIDYLVGLRNAFKQPGSFALRPMTDQEKADYKNYVSLENDLREELSIQHDEAA